MSEIIILPKSEVDDLKAKLDHLITMVSNLGTASNRKMITNDQLISDLGISKKTAQNWRTNGLIRFMRVGRKIYYDLKDVHETLHNHAFDSFKTKARKRQ